MPARTPIMTAETGTRELPGTQAASPRLHGTTAAWVDAFRRIAGALRLPSRATNNDTSFQRPDLIENDYFRFCHQPRD